MNITTTDSTTPENGISDGYWHAFSFSGSFNGVSLQPTGTDGVPLTEAPITKPGRRAILITEKRIDWVTSGGTAPNITITRRKIR